MKRYFLPLIYLCGGISTTREKAMASQTLRVLGEDVDMAEEYRFVGVSIDNRLNWKANIDAVYTKRGGVDSCSGGNFDPWMCAARCGTSLWDQCSVLLLLEEQY